MTPPTFQRLESLDVLRGFDLFCLVALEGVFHPLAKALDSTWFDSFMQGFTHVEWTGFSAWDLVMPLFMFMSGVSIPFALARFRTSSDKVGAYRRISKRVVLLWIFGMICQGNLLGLDPKHVYLYSNTLQAIAAGYLIASLCYLHCRTAVQITTTAGLMLIYWAAMEFISADGYGGGDYTPGGNLAEWIDRTVLGRFRDGASVQNGQVVFTPGYTYTWILSTLNFGATVLTGLFAGQILRSDTDAKRKVWLLLGIGIGMVITGWVWGLQMPVIKRIWTSSMVLVSSGYCFLLMAACYYWIDLCGHRSNLTWLKVYGMNSIAAYMLASVVGFGCIGDSLLHGFQQYIGAYYPALIAATNSLIIYLILRMLYNRKIFLKI